MSIVSEPSFESRYFRYRINECPVPLPPLVQHASGTTSRSTWRQIRWHIHYSMTKHWTRNQRKSRWQWAGRSCLVVFWTGGYPGIFLFHRGWRWRCRLLILGSGCKWQWTNGWAARWTGRRWCRLKYKCIIIITY